MQTNITVENILMGIIPFSALWDRQEDEKKNLKEATSEYELPQYELAVAAKRGDIGSLRSILSQYNPSLSEFSLALYNLIRFDHPLYYVSFLIERGADPNDKYITDRAEQTVWGVAASKSTPDYLRLLIHYGLDIGDYRVRYGLSSILDDHIQNNNDVMVDYLSSLL